MCLFSQGFSFPLEAGYALDSKQAKFYMMETHYNNPLSSADSIKSTNRQQADNSGLRLYYTNNLRKHDAGVLSIGMFVMWYFVSVVSRSAKRNEWREKKPTNEIARHLYLLHAWQDSLVIPTMWALANRYCSINACPLVCYIYNTCSCNCNTDIVWTWFYDNVTFCFLWEFDINRRIQTIDGHT